MQLIWATVKVQGAFEMVENHVFSDLLDLLEAQIMTWMLLNSSMKQFFSFHKEELNKGLESSSSCSRIKKKEWWKMEPILKAETKVHST